MDVLLVTSWEIVGRLGDEELVVVDCRSAEDMQRLPLQIPGAVLMSLEDIRESPWVLPDDECIVVYDGGEGREARRAARLLHIAERRAVILEGGIRAWISAGYPVQRVALRTLPCDREDVPDDEALAAGSHG